MTKPIFVYVSGPYTAPDPCININQAMQVGSQLLDAGFTPFIPHLYHFWHTVTPRPYKDWLRLDLEWLTKCEALVRFPGHSPGADVEVQWCYENFVPVFYLVEDCIRHFQQVK